MSRIGKKPIAIPPGVKVDQKGQTVKVTGPLGTLEMECHPRISVALDDSGTNLDIANPAPDDRRSKALHGTMRALIANMVMVGLFAGAAGQVAEEAARESVRTSVPPGTEETNLAAFEQGAEAGRQPAGSPVMKEVGP